MAYLVIYGCWLFVLISGITTFKDLFSYDAVSSVLRKAVCVSLFVLEAHRVLTERRWNEYLKAILVLPFFIVAAYNGKVTLLVDTALLVFGSRHVSFDKILKMTLGIQLIYIVITPLCACLGVINMNDQLMRELELNRNPLGFATSSTLSFLYLSVCMEVVCLFHNRLKNRHLLGMLIPAFVLFVLQDALTAFLLNAVLLIVVFLMRIPRLYQMAVVFVKKVGKWYFPATALIMLGLSVAYEDVPFWNFFNDLLNGRMYWCKCALRDFDITLFGQEIIWYGLENMERYNYVDFSLLQYLLQYGVVATAWIAVGYQMVIVRLIKRENYLLLFMVLIVVICGVIEPRLIRLRVQPFVLLLGQAFLSRKESSV